MCKGMGIKIAVGVGGFNKEQSSSELVGREKKGRKLIYAIDIDGTIAFTNGNDYIHSVPILEAVAKVNKLYNEGHQIKMFTARGSYSGRDWRELTEKQLKGWGVKYHELIFGKPSFDILVDDRSRREL